MTRTARIAGNILLAAIIASALYGGQVIFQVKRAHASANAFMNEAIPAIAGQWNPDELIKRAAPSLLNPAARAALPGYFSNLSRLGSLQNLHAPSGRIGSGAYPGTDINGRWAEYSAAGEFESGPARINMLAELTGHGWKIRGFQVESAVLEAKQWKACRVLRNECWGPA